MGESRVLAAAGSKNARVSSQVEVVAVVVAAAAAAAATTGGVASAAGGEVAATPSGGPSEAERPAAGCRYLPLFGGQILSSLVPRGPCRVVALGAFGAEMLL